MSKLIKNSVLLCCITMLYTMALSPSVKAASNPAGITINGGMQATLQDTILNNYGTILGGLKTEYVDTQFGTKFITYTGMLGRSNSSTDYNFSNFGKIIIHNSNADGVVGMLADGTIAGSHMLSNSGTISVRGAANVFGMSASTGGTGSHELSNSGTIIASGSNSVYGMYSIAHGGNNSLVNTNKINISGVGSLTGMQADGNGNHNLDNRGTIYAEGTAAEISGMSARQAGNHTLSNSNAITVIGGGGDNLYGMQAEGPGVHSLDNSGTINVKSNAAKVHGMHLQSSLEFAKNSHEISNSGSVTVSGLSSIYGIYAEVKSGTQNVNNSGTIEANGSNLVYGIYVAQVSGGNVTHNVTNTGYVSAQATNGIAFDLYGTTNYNIDTWATTLRNWSIDDTVFGVIDTQTINFSNTTLLVRPGTKAQGFAFGKTYNVADMLSTINQQSAAAIPTTANVSGTITKAAAEVPFLAVTLINGNDPLNATISLDENVSESTTPGSTTMQQSVAQVQSQFNSLSTSLRNALVTIYTQANLVADAQQNHSSGVAAGSEFIPQNKWHVFITPYANTANNTELDYSGNNMGVTAGASYRVNDNFSFGGHLDFNSANYYGNLMDMTTKSTSFALGLHATYNFTPEWYLRGQLTGSVNQNIGYYEASPTINGDANYNGEAVYIGLASGYTWEVAKGHTLTPEVGLAYLGTHTNAYDIDFGNTLYNMSYADSYYNALYGTLSLDWRSQWELENNSSIALLAGFGLRQNLGNGEMKTNVRTLGSNYSTETTEDPTTLLADVGIEYKKGNFSVSLNYEGGYGAHQTSHGGNVMVKLEF